MIILDEGHKARAARETRRGHTTTTRNNLLEFLHKVVRNASNVILGTATSIQLDAVELWDVLAALGQGAPHVLGTPLNAALSNRFGDIFSVLGQLPDAFEDQWIDAVLPDCQQELLTTCGEGPASGPETHTFGEAWDYFNRLVAGEARLPTLSEPSRYGRGACATPTCEVSVAGGCLKILASVTPSATPEENRSSKGRTKLT